MTILCIEGRGSVSNKKLYECPSCRAVVSIRDDFEFCPVNMYTSTRVYIHYAFFCVVEAGIFLKFRHGFRNAFF